MKELIEKYEELLNHEIPKSIKRRKSFLEIGNVPHFENVVSNYYAFYLDKMEEHKFEDLFLNSLCELIQEQSQKKIDFDDYEVLTEVSTANNGRIDILIVDYESKKAIIIENKIYHSLRNDLDDYWNTYNKFPENNVAGVLLTLEKQNTNNINFVNITHKQFLNQVNKNIGRFISNSDDRHLLFYKDFSENLMMLSNNKSDMKDTLKFYFEHKLKIEKLYEMRENMRKHFLDSVKNASILLGLDLENTNPKNYRCIIASENPSIRYWIVLNQSSEEGFIEIYIDVYGKSKKYSGLILENKLVNSIAEKNGIIIDDYGEEKDGISVAYKTYELNTEKFMDLDKNLVEIIEKDWQDLSNAIITEIQKLQ